MKSIRGLILAATVFGTPALHADVTIRYQTNFGKTSEADLSFSLRMKGTKGRVTSDGATMILDSVKREVTLLDAGHHQYAIIPASEYAGKVATTIAGMGGPGLDIFGAMKTKVESQSIGRPEVIHGVQAEGRQIAFTMEMPGNGERNPSDLGMKVVIEIWTAKPAEAQRIPAIRELAGFSLWQKLFLDPVEMLGPLAPKTSDTGNAMEKLFAEIGKNQSVLLRMHMEMFMPSMGSQPNQPGQAGTAPFMQMTQEVADISTAPVEDAEFVVPADYTVAPFDQVLEATMGGKAAAAKADAVSSSGPTPNPPYSGSVQAYVPTLSPVHQVEPDGAPGVRGMVELLVTVDPQGRVAQAEALTGPEALRKPAIDTVYQWTFRPVMREGHAVWAYTSANVDFNDWKRGAAGGNVPSMDETMAAMERLSSIEKTMPRSPQQVLADLEQDSGGGDAMRRYFALDEMAQAALRAGDEAKAVAYANELMHPEQPDTTNWNYGNAIHDGNMVLGLVAVRHGDIAAGRQHLLDAGKTPGSPVLDSFGPNMALAKALLEKGERDTVLAYFSECRKFWKMGQATLDAWTKVVRDGGAPVFAGNSR
jgi:hypothetical protein